MKVSFIGGFYGSGKTTLISEMSKKLKEDGKTVLFIDNEKGNSNVDPLFVRELGFDGDELTGGCICFYLDRLKEIMRNIEDKSKKDVLFVEPVSYFLPSKLYFDLRNEFGDEIDLSPITILLDGRELKDVLDNDREFPLIDARQVKDAEIVVINKLDLLSEDELKDIKEMVYELNPNVEIHSVSAKNGNNLDELLEILLKETHQGSDFKSPAMFQEYLKSVSGINERGEEFKFQSKTPLNQPKTQELVQDIFQNLKNDITNTGGKIHHIKAYINDGDSYIKASMPRATNEVDITGKVNKIQKGHLVLNVIAEEVPDDLIYGTMLKTIAKIKNKHKIKIEN
ncbi:GTPase G3E family [Methanonatronarchaeum thermophilum]|uniref:GTPase G3E family n=1 Tax=Methanonatronarchaeum thermophilum TaxID=1927129 RepID=A0A1Y3GD58_9EURY|nr:GTP-binding protein [Methanonatronarchaeum thermophilum]OUJ19180.1 GTPase G3E family [Methanonatronarchaeum thermophilum]